MCFVGKRAAVRNFLPSLESMTKEERRALKLTALAMCAVMEDKPKKGNKNERERFTYYVPFVGAVCKTTFESIYNISHRTLHLYRKRVRDDIVVPKIHGGHDNANANALDESLLAAWYVDFAENIGDVVPVRVRRGGIQDGTRRRYFSYDEYTLLPPQFTWDKLLDEYIKYLDDNYKDTPRLSRTSFIRILFKQCPKIKIRSGRDQVCDQCAIYRSAIAPDAGAKDTEVFGEHLVDAKPLRWLTEYKIDTAQAANNKLVFVMDFSENLTIPHVPDTPSAWYFLSLFSVSMFGVYCANDETHTHFLYSERKGGKGADEVISMLHHKLDLHGVFDVAFADPDEPLMQDKSVVVWCDNCGGQNKNSYLIWYLLFLVEHGVLQTACLKFFMKGHTKNACDRGFGHVKRHMAKAACWDIHTLIKAVEESATSIQAINLDATEQPFWSFKTYFQPRYKKSTAQDDTSAPTAETSTMAAFGETWRSIPKADDPPLNPEKQLDLFRKIRPFEPPEFNNVMGSNQPLHEGGSVLRSTRRAFLSEDPASILVWNMDATGTPLGPAVPETVELTIEGFPHLSSHEWMALERMRDVIGEAAVVSLLRSASPEDQKSAVVSFMHHEIMSSRKQVATPVSSLRTVPLKLDVSPYRGGENEPLSRWFVELDAAITARQLRDPSQQVLFAMSNLAGRAKSWAYGKRLVDLNCFPSYDHFKTELKKAFEPPQSEFRARAEFLKLRQGRFDLHSYAQRARYLVSSIVDEPIDVHDGSERWSDSEPTVPRVPQDAGRSHRTCDARRVQHQASKVPWVCVETNAGIKCRVWRSRAHGHLVHFHAWK
ncbi:hypothetical protein FI667_g12043, partial [Globisporangium splendens]